jgi:hypothetical protein
MWIALGGGGVHSVLEQFMVRWSSHAERGSKFVRLLLMTEISAQAHLLDVTPSNHVDCLGVYSILKLFRGRPLLRWLSRAERESA